MLAFAVVAIVLAALAPGAAFAGDVAVVVHPNVPVSDVKFAELRKIMRGDRQFWASGRPVTLIVRSSASPERNMLLEKVYEMSEAQFRQYWIAKVFRAESTSAPKLVLTNQMAAELIEALEGSVAFFDVKDLREGMKVLKIDGRSPGDKDYPLK